MFYKILSFIAFYISSTRCSHIGVEIGDGIPLSSKEGAQILTEARKLEDYYYANNNAHSDISYVRDYSFKVLGCHRVTDWDYDSDTDVEGAHLVTQQFLRVRLCPLKKCGRDYEYGCKGKNYGDYVVPISTFLSNYFQYKEGLKMSNCYKVSSNTCRCAKDNAECQFQCWYKNGMSQCYKDYTEDDNVGEDTTYRNYFTCTGWSPDEDQRRRTEDTSSASDDDDHAGDDVSAYEFGDDEYRQYYIGPYCAKKGTAVHLGLFTDSTCTDFAGSNGGIHVYKSLTGDAPDSFKNNLIENDCVKCNVPYSNDEYYQYQQENRNSLSPICEDVYTTAAKCEPNLNVYDKTVSGCNFVHGLDSIEQFSEKNPITAVRQYLYQGEVLLDQYINQVLLAAVAFFVVMILYSGSLERKLRTREEKRLRAFDAAMQSDARFKATYMAMID